MIAYQQEPYLIWRAASSSLAITVYLQSMTTIIVDEKLIDCVLSLASFWLSYRDASKILETNF